MKKKLLIFVLAVASIIMCSLCLAACSSEDNKHTHDWGKWTSDGATTHTHFCACGEYETKNHNLVNGSCTDCGYIVPTQNIEVNSLILNKNTLSLYVGDNETLTAAVLPLTATNKTISWVSLSPNIATVNNGNVIGISEGTTKILASTANGISDICNVTVMKNEFTVTFNCNGGTLISGNLVQKVKKGESAVAPILNQDGYAFSGWDTNFDYVTKNIIVTAVWNEIFNFAKNTITGLTAYGLTLTDIEVPSTINGSPVQRISDSAFINAINLRSIVISNSVSSLGRGIFEGCYNLESLTLPFIGASSGSPSRCVLGHIFGSNEYQDSIRITQQTKDYMNDDIYLVSYIPNSLNSVTITGFEIPQYAFENCSGLTNVTIGENVSSIGAYAFSGCSGITRITIPESVTTIGGSAFREFRGLTRIIIPDCVTKIADYAFEYCSNLASVTIGNNVTSIGNYAFHGCSKLTSIVIPDSVNSIGEYSFDGCNKLTSVDFGNNIKEIKCRAFSNCGELTKIEIPNSVTSIGNSAFWNCSKLTSISIPFVGAQLNQQDNTYFDYIFGGKTENIPSSLKTVIITDSSSISDYAFRDCTGLTSITMSDSITAVGKAAFYKCSNLTNITLSQNITSINTDTFFECNSLINIDIPDNVTTIDYRGFYGCTGLNSVVIPCNVKTIGDDAFRNCSGLTSIVIPNSVTSIGDGAFRNCSGLTNIVIPNSVTNIKTPFDNCKSLTIYCEATNRPSDWTSNWNFLDNAEYCPVVWDCNNNNVANDGYIYVIINEIRYALKNGIAKVCRQSTTIKGTITILNTITYNNISYSVTSIDEYSFWNCSILEKIIIPENITRIGTQAFYGCNNLTIYCETANKPDGWQNYWNQLAVTDDIRVPVVWDYKNQE